METVSAPLVSIIVAAYNPGRWLSEALGSLDAQTFRDFETIVVDDGSTPDLASDVSRPGVIYLRREENGGPAAARNLGIARSRGRYIAVLDADDLWMPTRLETLVELLEHDPSVGLATTDAYLIFGEELSRRTWFSTYETAIDEEPPDVRIFRSNFVSSQLIYRKALFQEHGLYDETLRVGEDWDRAIAFLLSGATFHLIPTPLAGYRVTPDSASRDRRTAIVSRIRILETWLSKPLSDAQSRAAGSSLQIARWDLAKLDLEERGSTDLLKDLVWPFRGAITIKGIAALAVPRLFLAVRSRRQRFVDARGGNWALHQAMESLDAGASGKAKRSMKAVVLSPLPRRIRVMAALWLCLPPARRYVEARLRVDRLVLSMTRRITD